MVWRQIDEVIAHFRPTAYQEVEEGASSERDKPVETCPWLSTTPVTAFPGKISAAILVRPFIRQGALHGTALLDEIVYRSLQACLRRETHNTALVRTVLEDPKATNTDSQLL